MKNLNLFGCISVNFIALQVLVWAELGRFVGYLCPQVSSKTWVIKVHTCKYLLYYVVTFIVNKMPQWGVQDVGYWHGNFKRKAKGGLFN